MRILLVDDDKDVLTVISQDLRDAGLDVVTESDAERAVDCIKTDHFDWLVTDGYMVGESGFDLAGQARLHQPKAKRILISGFYGDGQVTHALFHRVFRKPVDTRELIAYIKAESPKGAASPKS